MPIDPRLLPFMQKLQQAYMQAEGAGATDLVAQYAAMMDRVNSMVEGGGATGGAPAIEPKPTPAYGPQGSFSQLEPSILSSILAGGPPEPMGANGQAVVAPLFGGRPKGEEVIPSEAANPLSGYTTQQQNGATWATPKSAPQDPERPPQSIMGSDSLATIYNYLAPGVSKAATATGDYIANAADFSKALMPTPKQLGAGYVPGTGKGAPEAAPEDPWDKYNRTKDPADYPGGAPPGGGGSAGYNSAPSDQSGGGSAPVPFTPEPTAEAGGSGFGWKDFLGLLAGGRNYLSYKQRTDESAANRADNKSYREAMLSDRKERTAMDRDLKEKDLAVEYARDQDRAGQFEEKELGSDRRNALRALSMPMASDANPYVRSELQAIKSREDALRARKLGSTETKKAK